MEEILEGVKYNKLTVVGISETRPYNSTAYDCICDCGKETIATKYQLLKGKKQSCGCIKQEKGPRGSKYKVEKDQVFGRLTVASEQFANKDGHYRVKVVCECGQESQPTVRQLVLGKVVSCGCKRLEGNYIHGMHNSRPKSIYHHMKRRCTTEKEAKYEDYGGRGISYDPKWETFLGFWEDMEEGYSDELELDRIDVDGNYCKENCRWVDKYLQAFNTRKRKDNSSGKTGVYLNNKTEKWYSKISYEGKQISLGTFSSYEEACAARTAAEIEYYGFSKE